MSALKIHGQNIDTVFELIGFKEDDLSYSLAWVLHNCPTLLKRIVNDFADISDVKVEDVHISLQEFEKEKGFTDIEIGIPGKFLLAIEAKKGWTLPTRQQLEKYSKRERFEPGADNFKRQFAVLSECSDDYFHYYLGFDEINGIPVKNLQWKSVIHLIGQVVPSVGHAEKRLLKELASYLQKASSMQNQNTNWVYVVSLGTGRGQGWNMNWQEIVQQTNQYFHPFGKGWPKEPVNYIAFRYDGKLQSIHHVESHEVIAQVGQRFNQPFDPTWDGEPHFLYQLGPAIRPQHEVRTGKGIYRNGKVWCIIDTLLTANTITEAVAITKSRKHE